MQGVVIIPIASETAATEQADWSGEQLSVGAEREAYSDQAAANFFASSREEAPSKKPCDDLKERQRQCHTEFIKQLHVYILKIPQVS